MFKTNMDFQCDTLYYPLDVFTLFMERKFPKQGQVQIFLKYDGNITGYQLLTRTLRVGHRDDCNLSKKEKALKDLC